MGSYRSSANKKFLVFYYSQKFNTVFKTEGPIIIIEFLTSQLWLGNIHLSWDVLINKFTLGGLIFSLILCQELQIFAVYICIRVQVKSC